MMATLAVEPLAAVVLPPESWDNWLFSTLGSALDQSILQSMQFVVDRVMLPQPDEVDTLRLAASPFLHGELTSMPQRFFDFADATPEPSYVRSEHRRGLEGGAVVARELEVDYEPYSEAFRGQASPILVEHWVHDSMTPRATVLAVHGFTMGWPRIDSFVLFASECFRRGLDVALLTLPFHGPRTPSDARFSGERLAAPHVGRLNEGVRQAVYEIQVVKRWLQEESNAPVGMLGLSLGGYLSALMAGLSDDLRFVVPIVPPVCMGDLAWRFYNRSRQFRSVDTPPFSYDELRRMYRVHSPLTFSARVAKERLLIVAGRGDQIVPPEHPHSLWRHWQEPDIYWFSGSHVAPFGRSRMIAHILDHIDRSLAVS